MKLKLFKCNHPDFTEILACYDLPGPGSDPVQGLTFRGIFPQLDGLDPTDPIRIKQIQVLPTDVQFQTGCWQSFPSEQYHQIPLWLFRMIAHRIMSGMVMELFEGGQIMETYPENQYQETELLHEEAA